MTDNDTACCRTTAAATSRIWAPEVARVDEFAGRLDTIRRLHTADPWDDDQCAECGKAFPCLTALSAAGAR
jgi:hypothetical protein